MIYIDYKIYTEIFGGIALIKVEINLNSSCCILMTKMIIISKRTNFSLKKNFKNYNFGQKKYNQL